MEQKNLIENLSYRIFQKDKDSSTMRGIMAFVFLISLLGLVFLIDSLKKDVFSSIGALVISLSLSGMLILAYMFLEPFLFRKAYNESVQKAKNHKFQIVNKVEYKNGYHFKESCTEFTIKNYDDEAEVFLLSSQDNKLQEVQLNTFLNNYISLED